MFQFGQNLEHLSIVGKAVFGLSNRHDLAEATDYDRRVFDELQQLPPPQQCVLRSSAEEHWVAHFAAHLVTHAKQRCPEIEFSTFCEIPSKPSEKHKLAGYDLSIGPYDSSKRYRTMHKTTTKSWCDRPWTVSFNKKDIGHLKSLTLNQVHPFFIVVHSFYCIHDWRRMGQEATPDAYNQLDSDVTVPSLDSPVRTVIFELESVREFIGNTKIDKFKISRANMNSQGLNHKEKLSSLATPEAYSICVNDEPLMAGNSPLRPITLTKLRTLIDADWNNGWPDSKFVANPLAPAG